MIPDPASVGKVETLRTSHFRCLVDSTWKDCIQSLVDSGSEGAPERWAAWNEVKSSTVRTIYSGELNDTPVHLKLFRAVRLSDRARDALTGSRSERELQNLTTARERSLPCVQPIVAGTYAGSAGSRSFLVTRTEVGDVLPRGPLTESDAAAAGRLLRRVHDAGLHARDLHAGNVLRRLDGNLVLLDLTSAAFGDPLTERERGRALAYFCLDLDGNVRDAAARPLVEAYDPSSEILRHATQAARRLRNRSVSAFGRRAFRACSTTEVERRPRKPRVYLHVPAHDLWPAARTAIANLDAAEPIKSGRRGAVYVFEDVVVKERTAAAARQLFENAYWLSFAGVPTAMPVLCQTFRARGTIATSRLPFTNLLLDLGAGLASDHESLLACASSFGRAVGRLHSFGLRNRDMKFENLIRDPATQTIHVVDLDGVRRQLPGDNRGRAADLGRLLAAFEHSGRPGGDDVVRAFLRDT